MPWWDYFSNPLFWILMVSGFLLILMIGVLFLAIALEAIEGKNTGFRDIFVTNLIGVAFNYIPLVGIILYWRNVVVRHETGWDGAIAAWIIAWLIPAIIISSLFFLYLLPGFIPFWAL